MIKAFYYMVSKVGLAVKVIVVKYSLRELINVLKIKESKQLWQKVLQLEMKNLLSDLIFQVRLFQLIGNYLKDSLKYLK